MGGWNRVIDKAVENVWGRGYIEHGYPTLLPSSRWRGLSREGYALLLLIFRIKFAISTLCPD